MKCQFATSKNLNQTEEASMETRTFPQQKAKESQQLSYIHDDGHSSHLAGGFDSFEYAEVHNEPGQDQVAAELPANAA